MDDWMYCKVYYKPSTINLPLFDIIEEREELIYEEDE